MDRRIYTRQGDGGMTQHPDASRVRKDHPDLERLGALDELNAQIGAARAALPSPATSPIAALPQILRDVQQMLFRLGALLHDGSGTHDLAASTAALEDAIDRLQAELPPLDRFILPAGHSAAAALHVARAVCRRAERVWVAAHSSGRDLPADERSAVAYLNRLSDLLFVAARGVNHAAGGGEELLP